MICWYDLGPLTPKAWGEQIAWDWTEAVELRSAAQEGIAHAHADKQGHDRMMSDDVAEAG